MPLGPAAKDLLYCYVGECESMSIARGLCRRHYEQAWRKDTLPPRVPHEKRVKQGMVISQSTDSKLRKLARQTGRSVGEILRDIVEGALASMA